MSAADTLIALSRDPRFSPYAMSAVPAWLWAPAEQRLLWANASGAALLGAPTPAALAEHRYASDDPLADEIARVAATLPPTGAPRLGQVQLGTHKLTCTCSRTALPGDAHGVLIIGSEPMRPALPLAERAARLFSPGSQAVAVFSADGKLLYATGELDADTTLATLGADALKSEAVAAGVATGESAIGPLTLMRLGRGGTTVLVATHDRDMVDRMRRRVLALDEGRLVRDEASAGYHDESTSEFAVRVRAEMGVGDEGHTNGEPSS